MKLDLSTQKAVSASLLRMSVRSPYFYTLAMFARFELSEQIPTAATDGRSVFINKSFWEPLTPPEQDGLLLHEILHAALQHLPRREGRDPELWNIAADAVINGMILKEGYDLPKGGVIRPDLENLSVAEAYERVLREREQSSQQQSGSGNGSGEGNGQSDSNTKSESRGKGNPQLGTAPGKDLLPQAPSDAEANSSKPSEPSELSKPSNSSESTKAANEGHWQNAHEQAKQAANGKQAGKLPGNLMREMREWAGSRLDWRTYLWRYLTQTPTDFTDFDRRFVGNGVYLDTISGESVQVLVCVDTSSSINNDYLRCFVGELQGILRAYPHMRCELYYADTELYGPYPMRANTPIPTPQGGGGTDFRPFFEAIRGHAFGWGRSVAIYLTDGWGNFPAHPSKIPTLWVVTPGGIDLDKFPFGEAIRLLPSQHTPFVKN